MFLGYLSHCYSGNETWWHCKYCFFLCFLLAFKNINFYFFSSFKHMIENLWSIVARWSSIGGGCARSWLSSLFLFNCKIKFVLKVGCCMLVSSLIVRWKLSRLQRRRAIVNINCWMCWKYVTYIFFCFRLQKNKKSQFCLV